VRSRPAAVALAGAALLAGGCGGDHQPTPTTPTIFKVTVLDVNVSKVPAKPKRRGMSVGTRPGWKKAVVTVAAGETIEAFGPGV